MNIQTAFAPLHTELRKSLSLIHDDSDRQEAPDTGTVIRLHSVFAGQQQVPL
jgi:hypothetical protein